MNNYIVLIIISGIIYLGKSKYEVDTKRLQYEKDKLKNQLKEANNKYEQIYLKYKSTDYHENELLCMV